MIGPGVFTIELWAAQSPGETHAYGGEGRNTHKKVVTKCESGRHRTTHATSATRMHEHSLHHRHEFGSIATFRLSLAAAHVDFAAIRIHHLPPERARHRKVLRAEDPHRSLRPLLQELRWRGRQQHNVVFRLLLVQLLQTSLVLKRLHVRTQVRQKVRWSPPKRRGCHRLTTYTHACTCRHGALTPSYMACLVESLNHMHSGTPYITTAACAATEAEVGSVGLMQPKPLTHWHMSSEARSGVSETSCQKAAVP